MEYERITIECSDHDGSLKKLIAYLGINGNSGHSFSIVVDPDDSERRKTFGWDGDGSDRIVSINGEKLEKWTKKYFTNESEGGNAMGRAKDAMKFDYKIEALAYKDGVIKIKVSNDYWDTSDYAFWDGKKIYSYSSVAADYVKNALKDVKVDPRTIKPGYKKRFVNYGSSKNMDAARVESQVIEEKNGYKLGKVDTGHGPRIVLAFPGESLENPHMWLGEYNASNFVKGKQMFEKFAKTKDTKDAKVLGHVKEAAKILGISENDLEDRGYEKGYELIGHKKTGAILAKKNIRSGKMIVYKERMTKDAIPSNLSKSKIVNSKDRADREMNRMLGNSGQYTIERTGIAGFIYKNKISKKIIGYYNDMSGDLYYDPKEMVRDAKVKDADKVWMCVYYTPSGKKVKGLFSYNGSAEGADKYMDKVIKEAYTKAILRGSVSGASLKSARSEGFIWLDSAAMLINKDKVKDSKGGNNMAKVYDPIMNMLVDVKVKAKDADEKLIWRTVNGKKIAFNSKGEQVAGDPRVMGKGGKSNKEQKAENKPNKKQKLKSYIDTTSKQLYKYCEDIVKKYKKTGGEIDGEVADDVYNLFNKLYSKIENTDYEDTFDEIQDECYNILGQQLEQFEIDSILGSSNY